MKNMCCCFGLVLFVLCTQDFYLFIYLFSLKVFFLNVLNKAEKICTK